VITEDDTGQRGWPSIAQYVQDAERDIQRSEQKAEAGRCRWESQKAKDGGKQLDAARAKSPPHVLEGDALSEHMRAVARGVVA
jgi:hypothetical protein